jgi:peptidoglycan/LPS O-acetylase OafA/YrhL
MKSVSQKLDETHNRPSGFDYMRLFLSLSVISWHTVVTSYGDEAQGTILGGLWTTPVSFIVPMFFALSGFLVAGSFERCKTLVRFLGLRALRIVPALAVEVCLSALLLGPCFTTLPLIEYYTNSQFYTYFFNVMGDIHYFLPGVFDNNPHHKVNSQLWTVPLELFCYVALTFLATLSTYKRKGGIIFILAILYIIQVGKVIVPYDPLLGHASNLAIVMYFIAGLGLYRYRNDVILSYKLFMLSLICALVLMNIPDGNRFTPIFIGYITVYLGTLNPARNKVLLSGDYSYGLYLYGFPIQQALVALGIALNDWLVNILLSIPCAGAVAALSWWLVERPVLDLRTKLDALEWFMATRKSIR